LLRTPGPNQGPPRMRVRVRVPPPNLSGHGLDVPADKRTTDACRAAHVPMWADGMQRRPRRGATYTL